MVGYPPRPYDHTVMVIDYKDINHRDRQLDAFTKIYGNVVVVNPVSSPINANICANALRRQITQLEKSCPWWNKPLLWRLKKDYATVAQWYDQYLSDIAKEIADSRKRLVAHVEEVDVAANRLKSHREGYVPPPAGPMVYTSPHGVEAWYV